MENKAHGMHSSFATETLAVFDWREWVGPATQRSVHLDIELLGTLFLMLFQER